ncbi:MAG: hypothetical protein AB7O96_05530 [Pseudobdellovibrionaceae bacterium]
MAKNQPIELEIRQLLLEQNNATASNLLDQIIRSAESKDISEFDLNSLATFLLNRGMYVPLFRLCLTRMEKKRAVPWAQLAEAASHVDLITQFEFRKSLLECAVKEDRKWHLLLSNDFLDQEELLRPDATLERRKFHEEYEKAKFTLGNQMQFFFTQHMLEQERKLLNKFEKLYPGDREIAEQKKAFIERNARDVLSKKNTSIPFVVPFETNPLSATETAATSQIYQASEEHLVETPEYAIDFAVLFEMMDDYDHAFAALRFALPSLSQKWLECELLLLSRRYLEALELIRSIEAELAADPETVYACAYLRAQSLWGLGERSVAIEILEGLVVSRPQYRSAASLLQIWRGT